MVGVEQWAEIRRLVLVERRSQRQVARLLGIVRDTVARAVASGSPPRYERPPVVSKLDPFKEWICEQLRADLRLSGWVLGSGTWEARVLMRAPGSWAPPWAGPD